MSSILDKVEWFENKPAPKTIRISANLSTGAGRITFNAEVMKQISSDYIQIGFIDKKGGEEFGKIVFKEADNGGDDFFSLVKTEKSKSATVNFKNKALFFKNNNLLGLFEVEYMEEENIYMTIEKIEKENYNDDDE